MLFDFVKYIQPIWYFNQKPGGEVPYWIDYRKLPDDYAAIVQLDGTYKEEISTVADAAFQLYYNGLVWNNGGAVLQMPAIIRNVEDNYLFVRRFFRSTGWFIFSSFVCWR